MKKLLQYKLHLGGGDWCSNCATYGYVDDHCLNCGYSPAQRPGK